MLKIGVIDWVALILLLIGGLNWGLIGFFNFNLVETIFFYTPTLAKIIYALVGLASVWIIVKLFKVKRPEED
jgi:uncharacterized membrane protein YuzA (DUF378 family)